MALHSLPRGQSRRGRLLSVLAVISMYSLAAARELPPGGTTEWEISELEAVVAFLLFDPNDPEIALPKGLRFVSLGEIPAPEFQDHLQQHPERSGWVFSFVEFVRPKTWLLDGKAPTFPENGAVGVWFAPVDHSQLGAEISTVGYEALIASTPDAVLVLGLWMPDRKYAAYMRGRGHHASYGMVTLVEHSDGTLQGELRLDRLSVKASVTPRGGVTHDPDPFTQLFFEPGETVERIVILHGSNAREQGSTAEWSTNGDHPLARGVFVGPTFLNVEGPLTGSAYHLGAYQDR